MQAPADLDSTIGPKLDAIGGRAETERIRSELGTLHELLGQAPLWRPGAALQKSCAEISGILENLETRLDRKLVATLIGPTGAGKSTLLNALTGVDDLSPAGHQRPTTRSLVVLCAKPSDAAQLVAGIGQSHVEIRAVPASVPLKSVILVDTPDTDSTDQRLHGRIVKDTIALSDVLICVFDAENPKRMDHVDFLAEFIGLFNGESLGVVLNKCDRLDEEELKKKIVPEFTTYLGDAWGMPVTSVLCVSARRNLNHPGWDPAARPKHDFDQFYLLRELVFGTLGQSGTALDRRLANAASLRDYAFGQTLNAVGQDRDLLERASGEIARARKAAMDNAVMALAAECSHQLVGLNVLLYQKLAQRWLGPLGWVTAIWARLLIFGSGLAAMFRFGRPLSQIWGVISSLRQLKDSRAAVEEIGRGGSVHSALNRYRMAFIEKWPPAAETLVKARFNHTVREIEQALPEEETLARDLTESWGQALESTLEQAAAGLSHFLLQLIFNLPVLALLTLAGWRTTRDFINGTYLPANFFLHALLTIGIVLLLSFFVLQAFIRMAAGPRRLAKKAFDLVQTDIGSTRPGRQDTVSRQIDVLLHLHKWSRPGGD